MPTRRKNPTTTKTEQKAIPAKAVVPTSLCDFCKNQIIGKPYGVSKDGKNYILCGESCAVKLHNK